MKIKCAVAFVACLCSFNSQAFNLYESHKKSFIEQLVPPRFFPAQPKVICNPYGINKIKPEDPEFLKRLMVGENYAKRFACMCGQRMLTKKNTQIEWSEKTQEAYASLRYFDSQIILSHEMFKLSIGMVLDNFARFFRFDDETSKLSDVSIEQMIECLSSQLLKRQKADKEVQILAQLLSEYSVFKQLFIKKQELNQRSNRAVQLAATFNRNKWFSFVAEFCGLSEDIFACKMLNLVYEYFFTLDPAVLDRIKNFQYGPLESKKRQVNKMLNFSVVQTPEKRTLITEEELLSSRGQLIEENVLLNEKKLGIDKGNLLDCINLQIRQTNFKLSLVQLYKSISDFVYTQDLMIKTCLSLTEFSKNINILNILLEFMREVNSILNHIIKCESSFPDLIIDAQFTGSDHFELLKLFSIEMLKSVISGKTEGERVYSISLYASAFLNINFYQFSDELAIKKHFEEGLLKFDFFLENRKKIVNICHLFRVHFFKPLEYYIRDAFMMRLFIAPIGAQSFAEVYHNKYSKLKEVRGEEDRKSYFRKFEDARPFRDTAFFFFLKQFGVFNNIYCIDRMVDAVIIEDCLKNDLFKLYLFSFINHSSYHLQDFVPFSCVFDPFRYSNHTRIDNNIFFFSMLRMLPIVLNDFQKSDCSKDFDWLADLYKTHYINVAIEEFNLANSKGELISFVSNYNQILDVENNPRDQVICKLRILFDKGFHIFCLNVPTYC